MLLYGRYNIMHSRFFVLNMHSCFSSYMYTSLVHARTLSETFGHYYSLCFWPGYVTLVFRFKTEHRTEFAG